MKAKAKFGNKSSFKPSKVRDVPAGESFVQHWSRLIESRAWRSLSRYAFLALFRLEAEHCNHAGKENGWLVVTYDQFEEWGIPRRWIKPVVTELVNAKLLVIERQGRAAKGDGVPSLYRLTYLKSKFVPVAGSPRYIEPSSDWQALEDPNATIPDQPKPQYPTPSLRKSFFSVTPVVTEPVTPVVTEQNPARPNSADPLSNDGCNYYLHYGVPKRRRTRLASPHFLPSPPPPPSTPSDRRFRALAGCIRRPRHD
jgi:hypothetical protein